MWWSEWVNMWRCIGLFSWRRQNPLSEPPSVRETLNRHAEVMKRLVIMERKS